MKKIQELAKMPNVSGLFAMENFFEQQTPDYQSTLYQTHDGLDCSGYVGWTIYNLMESTSGNSGYVMKSGEMASTYAS